MRAENNAALLVAHIWLDAMLICGKGASVRHEGPLLSCVKEKKTSTPEKAPRSAHLR
jgi:hypothetical protein